MDFSNKVKDLFSQGLLLILFVPIGVILLFFLPFYIVYDYIKYKTSAYYKKEHEKYHMFSATGLQFKFYNIVLENNFPIRFIKHPAFKTETFGPGWFVKDRTLVIVEESFEYVYSDDLKEWVTSRVYDKESVDGIKLSSSIEDELENINSILGEKLCDNAVLLVDIVEFEQNEIHIAQNDQRFIIYDNDITQALKILCRT